MAACLNLDDAASQTGDQLSPDFRLPTIRNQQVTRSSRVAGSRFQRVHSERNGSPVPSDTGPLKGDTTAPVASPKNDQHHGRFRHTPDGPSR